MIFLAVFVAALVSALFASTLLIDHLWRQKDYLLMEVSKPNDIRYMVSNAIVTVEDLDKGNADGVYARACTVLSGFGKYLHSETYSIDPLQQAEMRELELQAIEVERRLRNEGRCRE